MCTLDTRQTVYGPHWAQIATVTRFVHSRRHKDQKRSTTCNHYSNAAKFENLLKSADLTVSSYAIAPPTIGSNRSYAIAPSATAVLHASLPAFGKIGSRQCPVQVCELTTRAMPCAATHTSSPASREQEAHIIVHFLAAPLQVELRLPTSTKFCDMLGQLRVKCRLGSPLQRVTFRGRGSLPVQSSVMLVPNVDDLQRALHEYGFGSDDEPDHLYVVLELGGDPQRTPQTFSYDAAQWLSARP